VTKHFQNQIENLKKRILNLTALVEQNLELAVRSVEDRDVKLAVKVIATDDEIDHQEVEIEEECLKTLALYQPVASDLRFIIAVLKINSDIERIGDLAVNIAQRAKSLADSKNRNIPFDLPGMFGLTISMVKKSTDALVLLDPELAREVGSMDDRIDEMHKGAYKTVEEEIIKEPQEVEYYINLLGVSRYLERIADHATNIAEDVVYLVEGQIVRHQNSV
jgi:phosphate transport system protein